MVFVTSDRTGAGGDLVDAQVVGGVIPVGASGADTDGARGFVHHDLIARSKDHRALDDRNAAQRPP